MSAPAALKTYNISKYLTLSFEPALEGAMVHEFSLQGSGERFCYRVVIAGAGAAHTLDSTDPLHQRLKSLAAILRSPIRVKNNPWRGAPPYHGVVERCDHEVVCHPPLHAPSNYAAGEDIQNDCQIQPALGCPDIGDISCPKTIRRHGREVPTPNAILAYENALLA
jgi:hypothetical protein